MTSLKDRVEALDDATLKLTALALGIKPHHRAGRASIIGQIMQQAPRLVEEALNPSIQGNAPPPPQAKLSQEEVEESLADYIAKDGFRIKFDDLCVHMSYKGKVECTTLYQPLRMVRNVAERISRPTFVPKIESDPHGNILMG